MKKMDWTSGKNFEVVALSFNPKEKSDLAKEKKEAYLKEYGRPDGAKGWHFLVGSQANIKKVADEIGFQYKWDPEQNQYAHTSALFVLTGSGKISRYFYGIDYPPQSLKVAMLEAGEGKIGNIVDKILLFCYHYDSSTKKYVLLASRIMTLGGGLTVLILGCFFAYTWRRERILAHS
jgi:protein SCO1/2